MKKKKVWILAAVFILVCGGVCVWLRMGSSSGKVRFERGSGGATAKQDVALDGVKADEGGQTTVSELSGMPEGTESAEKQTAVTQAPGVLYVHMCGAVVQEGVYMLPSGSRLTDGITAAGGFTEEADTSFHNLAAYLQDGQKVYVPTKEEVKDVSVEERLKYDAFPEAGIPTSGQNGSVRKVNLNTADVSELMTLSGVGQSKAEAIIQYRMKVGAFSSIEELKNVTGIGDAMFERIKEYITVDG